MIVDSGASFTLLAKEYLRQLGIKQRGPQAEIDRDPTPATGVKSRFVTWYSNVLLTAQVVLPLAPGSSPSPSANWTPWGSTFELDARFANRAPGLAGRRDFFRNFVVTFIEDATNPRYTLTER
jgi:hypothetical protein